MTKRIVFILAIVCIINPFGLFKIKNATAQDYDAVSHDLNQATSYDFRIDGYTPGMYVGVNGVKTADLDGDDKQDIIVSGYTSTQGRSGNGSLWIIYGSLLESLAGVTKVLDLSDTDHYSLRFDGARDNEMLANCRGGARTGDFDNDGKTDLVIPNWQASYGGNESGSVYLISNTIFGSITGTGNNIDLNTSSNWTTRYDGAAISDRLSNQGVYVDDVDNDTVDDVLITSENTGYNDRDYSGSVYVLSNALIATKKVNATGNIVTITDSSAWWLRVDGAVAGDALGSESSIAVADWGGNDKNDLAVGSLVADEYYGQVWLINDSILDDYSGNGNTLDLGDPTKYSTLIGTSTADSSLNISKDASTDYDSDGIQDMAISSGQDGTYIINSSILAAHDGPGDSIDVSDGDSSVQFSDLYNGAVFADFNGDGIDDMLSGDGSFDSLTRTNNGGAFVSYNEIYDLPGSGNTMTVMDDLRHHSVRYDGPADHFRAGGGFGFSLGDVNGDGRNDVVLSSDYASYNGDPFDYTGSVWVIFNFPHTITIDSSTESGGNTLVEGSVDATDSLTDIVGVVGSLEGEDDWNNCTPDDGNFNSTVEDFSCTIDGTNAGNDVDIRAFDDNYSYSIITGDGGPTPSRTSTPTPTPTTTATNTPGPDEFDIIVTQTPISMSTSSEITILPETGY